MNAELYYHYNDLKKICTCSEIVSLRLQYLTLCAFYAYYAL